MRKEKEVEREEKNPRGRAREEEGLNKSSKLSRKMEFWVDLSSNPRAEHPDLDELARREALASSRQHSPGLGRWLFSH
ncbi:hypothetical protein L195_g008087 [Trifolium pratense]|uniref:Uncharacterized protein n=1 Tax=Trifolium pratense TaxID=57577 RepID=A0A2K3P869_TRIPR|nr:hypothetical protein L195_g008087 [Trifolium pratense]